MHELIADRRAEVARLCDTVGIRRLDVFGSATNDMFDVVRSDIDVVVRFAPPPEFDRYFDLKEGLERIFERPVDVVIEDDIKNPYFADSVNRTRENLYAA